MKMFVVAVFTAAEAENEENAQLHGFSSVSDRTSTMEYYAGIKIDATGALRMALERCSRRNVRF